MGDYHLMTEVSMDNWEAFLRGQTWSPFLQSWPMGEVYRAIGQEPVRIAVEEDGEIVAVCLAVEVPARRGKHLMVQYGPVVKDSKDTKGTKDAEVLSLIVEVLRAEAKKRGCGFVRMSPFWDIRHETSDVRSEMAMSKLGFRPSPLHLLAEHIWFLDLECKTEEDVLMGLRKTTRNLVRRAEKEGVTVAASDDPIRDLPIFFMLYEETCKRHHFVPYSREFIEAQVREFLSGCHAVRLGVGLGGAEPRRTAEPRRKRSDDVRRNEDEADRSPSSPLRSAQGDKSITKGSRGCSLYIAQYNGEPVSASVHMHFGKETSYHHGASTTKYPKCFASYLLQWTAIKEAIARGDNVYNFWGIAPSGEESGKWKVENEKHPFAGVTLFKTGFGGELINLVHCMDLPISSRYWLTWWFEMLRKWKRGF